MFLNTEKQLCAGLNLFWEQALLGDVTPSHPSLTSDPALKWAKAELEITVGKDKLEEKTKNN